MKFRLILVAIVAVIAGVVGAVTTAYTWMFGEGEVHVLASEDADLLVSMDGTELGAVTAGTVGRFHVSQGNHTFSVGPAGEPSVDVSVDVTGWTEVIVGTPGRCMAQLDVTNGIYNEREGWKLEAFHDAGEVISMPDNGGTSFVDLPDEIKEYDRAHLVLDVPCDAKGDTEAIEAIGMVRMYLENGGSIDELGLDDEFEEGGSDGAPETEGFDAGGIVGGTEGGIEGGTEGGIEGGSADE